MVPADRPLAPLRRAGPRLPLAVAAGYPQRWHPRFVRAGRPALPEQSQAAPRARGVHDAAGEGHEAAQEPEPEPDARQRGHDGYDLRAPGQRRYCGFVRGD